MIPVVLCSSFNTQRVVQTHLTKRKKYVKSEGMQSDSAKGYGNASKRDGDVHMCMQSQ
jgi:hypothetical protein